ncbi:hypothetical protein, partial [Haladaptatus sp. W1]|uniref:hypothetical protein n=1 Tax=Haladaptatus sp. W1 TaxID=1897478 RepID=UPI001C2F13A4
LPFAATIPSSFTNHLDHTAAVVETPSTTRAKAISCSLFPVIGESEFSLDFVEMALTVQPFDDIFGSRPLEVFFLG